MEYYFITGTSKGLGKALAEKLLDKGFHVIGISRNKAIDHANYKHHFLDLSIVDDVKRKASGLFEEIEAADKIVLVNNAGILGEVAHVGGLSNDSLIKTFNVNIIAPALLTNDFIKKYLYHPAHKLVVNISSGAGKKPTDGWAGYCSSKAALDMFTQVVGVEKQKDKHNLKIVSISPGIVDTPMQDEIRKMNPEDFSRVNEFIDYKKQNMLVSPDKVAEKVMYIMDHEDEFTDRLLSVRDVQAV